MWRGTTLMGAGTPGHVNDPTVTGIWRPRDPANFFVDDPAGNISSIGAYRHDIAGLSALRSLALAGTIDGSCILTSTFHVKPSMIDSAATLMTLETDVLQPLGALRDAGQVVITDFTRLIATWNVEYASKACIYME